MGTREMSAMIFDIEDALSRLSKGELLGPHPVENREWAQDGRACKDPREERTASACEGPLLY
jgi:hypothetical protein